MKTLKKVLSVILCAITLITAAPLSGFVGMKFPELDFGKIMHTLNSFSTSISPVVNAGEIYQNVEWGVWENRLYIHCNGNMPDFVDIDPPWYSYRDSVTEIVFYDETTSIGKNAFRDFSKTKKIRRAVEKGEGTNAYDEFFDYLPDSITSIGNEAFAYCSSLENVQLPKNLQSIGSQAFYATNIKSVDLPSKVKEIGRLAFSPSVVNITVDPLNNFYSANNNILFNKAGTELLLYPSTKTDTSYTIPSTIKAIGDYAFYHCIYLNEIQIPDSVMSIGKNAFDSCISLTHIQLPDSVTSIGEYAFYWCASLTNIEIPDSVTSIDEYAFFWCSSLTNIEIPDSVTSIGEYAFAWCDSLTNIEIPDRVTSIGKHAFDGCDSLTNIEIPDRVTSIGEDAFAWCDSLTKIQISATVKIIGNYAFSYCDNLTNIEFLSIAPPEVSTSIFSGSPISTISIPQLSEKPEWNQYAETGWQGIPVVDSTDPNDCPLVFLEDTVTDKYGFTYNSFDAENHTVCCSGYDGSGGDVVVPRIVVKDNEVYYVTKINSIFGGTNSTITSLRLPNTLKSVDFLFRTTWKALENTYVEDGSSDYISVDGVIFSKDKTKLVFYPSAKPETSYTICAETENIGALAFAHSPYLKSIDFEADSRLLSISANAFDQCINLESISLPSSLTEILNFAFYGCRNLKTVTFPADSNLKNIYSCAWYNCTALENISLPEGLKKIYDYAFYNCSSLKKVFLIPSTVTHIGKQAFFGCGIDEVIILKNVSDIGAGAFANCTNLETISVEYGSPYYKSVYGILYNSDETLLHTYPSGKKNEAFTIPSTVNSINASAFYGAQQLKKIDFSENATTTSIGEEAFSKCQNLQSVSIDKCSEIASIGNRAFSNTSLEGLTFTCKTAPTLPENTSLFSDSPIKEVYVADLYLKESWIDYLDSGFGGLPLMNKSTTGSTVSGVDNNNRDSLGFTYNKFDKNTRSVNIKEFTGSGDVDVPRYVFKDKELYFVRSFDQEVFAGNKEITSISFADKIEAIPDSAFSGCTDLKSVSFTSNISEISSYAFSGCTSLSSVRTNGIITKVGSGAFFNCSALNNFSFRAGLESIGDDAFSGCISLPSVIILPASLKNIGDRAFDGCSFKTVQFEGKLSYLGENAFDNNDLLTRAKFKSDPPESTGSTPFGSPDAFVVVYPEENAQWNSEISNLTWKGYPAYTYSLISQLSSDEDYPIIVMVTTPDGAPFEGAAVTLGDKKTTSNEDGIAVFSYPGEEKQKLVVTPGGEVYLESNREVVISRRSPVIIVSLFSSSDLIEIMVDEKDTDIYPAVFNNASNATADFYIKTLADNIEKVEILSDDECVLSFSGSLKNGVTQSIYIERFHNMKPVSVRVTEKGSEKNTAEWPLNITVFDGGKNFGLSISQSGEDDPDSKKFKLDQSKIAADDAKIDLAGSGIDALKDISIDIPLKKLICGISYEVSQEKDSIKLSCGLSEDGDEIGLKGWDRAKRNNLIQLEESTGLNMNYGYAVGGYLSFSYTSKQEAFLKEACMYLYVEIELSFGATWMVIIPLRLDASFSGDATFTVGLTKDYADSYTDLVCETNLGLSLRLNLGIGIAVASAGIYGKGRLETSIPSLVSTLSGEFGAYVKVLWFKYDYSILKGSVTFGGRKETKAEELLQQNSNTFDTAKLEPIKLHEASQWSVSPVDDGENVSLQTDIYNYIRPQIASAGDTTMMVFERLNTDFSIQNSQELVYSLYNKSTGTWSKPQPVEPGNRQFDNSFKLYSDGTDIYIIFTQANSELANQPDSAEKAALYQDVYVTKYDAATDSFAEPVALTNDSFYDAAADIAVIDGIPTAVWTRNENGEPFTLDNSNSIYMSRFENGQWGESIRMAAGLNSITGFGIGALNGKQYIAAAVDSDNNLETIDDSKLLFIDSDKNIIPGNIEGFGGNCEFTNINNNDVLLAYCNGKAVTISSPDAEAADFTQIPEISAASDAKFIEYEPGMYAISYVTASESGGCVRAVTFDGEEWHDAITLSESESYIGAYALDYLDGQFIVVAREDDLIFTSGTDFDVNSTLGSIAFTPSEELYVSDAVIDSAGIVPGKEFIASLNIVNNSLGYSQLANIILKDSYGNVISSSAVEVDLQSGESKYVDVTLTAPDMLDEGGYTITAEPVAKARAMRFNTASAAAKEPKSFGVSLTSSDLCIETKQVILGSSQNILVNVTNDGNASSSTGLLKVKKGDIFAADEPFSQIELGIIKPAETKSYLIEVPGDVYTDEQGIVSAFIETENDLYSYNNASTLAIMEAPECDFVYTEDENTSPKLSTSSIEADLYKISDKTVEITLNENTFTGIDGLSSGTHYSFSGSTLTLKKSYLSTLPVGTHEITLNFKGQYENYTETLIIHVKDTSPITLTGSVIITGEAAPGKTLSINTDNVSPAFAGYDIQWFVGGVAASSENTYKVKESDTGKQIYVKLTAKGDYSGSLTSAVLTVEKTSGFTEFAPVEASKSCNSITLKNMDGYEYRISTGDWSSDTVFNNLSADTEYTFYCRKTETEYSYAGAQSTPTVIKTTGHAEGTPPTCSSPQKCTVCGAEIRPVTAHMNTKTVEAVEATCSETGYTEGVYCLDCENYVSGHTIIEINSNNHEWDNGLITTEATCSINGIKTYTCLHNSAHKKTENLGLNTEIHQNTINTNSVSPTCSDVGYTEGIYCNDCKKYISGHEEIGINSSNHLWDSGSITTEATCKVNGIKTFTCAYDRKHTYTEDLGLNTDNHVNTQNTEKVSPTCSQTGYTEGVYCNDCEKYISGHEEIAVDDTAHKWNNGEITTTATCTVSGIKTYTCEYDKNHTHTEKLGTDSTNHINTTNTDEIKATCSATGFTAGVYCNDCETYISGHEEIAVDNTAHKWNNGEITTTATCKVSGIKTYTCEYDKNHTHTKKLGTDSTNHINTTNTDEIKATCSVTGFTAGVYCNDCKTYISGHEEIAVDNTAHKWNNGEITTTATCKVSGIKTYTCEYDINHTYTEDLGINSANHINTEPTEKVEATCSATGFTAGVYCNDCEKYLSGHEVIAVDEAAHKWNDGEITTTATCKVNGIKTYTCEYDINHTYTEDLGINSVNHTNTEPTEKVEATCSATGFTAGVYCNDCEKYLSGHEEIAVDEAAHKWNDGETITVATCKINGVKLFTCEYDKTHTYTENIGRDDKNHINTAVIEAKPPTCSSFGYTEGVVCYDCLKYISGHHMISFDNTSHRWDDGKITTIPTCIRNGVKTFTCERDLCHYTYTENIGLNTENHESTVYIQAVAPTCTKTGFTAGSYCYDCEKYFYGHEVIAVDEAAHKWDSGTVTTVATCNVSGVKTYTCAYDKNHTYTEDLGINSANHTNTKPTEKVEATCSATGFTAGVYCNDCEKYISGHEEIGINTAKHKNVTSINATKATCTSIGYTSGSYCNDCKKFVSGHKEIPSLGHSYKSAVTPPTCTTDGFTTYICTRCNNTYTDNTVKATGHSYKSAVTPPTCTTDGFTTYICTRCNNTYTDNTVKATGHSYKSAVTPPTCTTDGFTTYICTRCNNTYTDNTVKATGHSYKSAVTPPTCTTEGFTTHTCTGCNDTYINEKVKATGHRWGEWTEILAPTLTENGKEERICSLCKAKETRATDKLTLSLGDVNGDGKITAADARTALRASVKLDKLNAAETTAADIDRNGKITASDARHILRASVGLEDFSKNKKITG